MTLEKQLESSLKKQIKNATDRELYDAIVAIVKEKQDQVKKITGEKKLYYISAEFLIGKQLGKNLINLGLYDELAKLLSKNGKSIRTVESFEKEPSLGNGGLGRLAACFLDSIATLNLQGDGVGLNYHLGLFRQEFKDRKQHEIPDEWLNGSTVLRDTNVSFPVELAGKEVTGDAMVGEFLRTFISYAIVTISLILHEYNRKKEIKENRLKAIDANQKVDKVGA